MNLYPTSLICMFDRMTIDERAGEDLTLGLVSEADVATNLVISCMHLHEFLLTRVEGVWRDVRGAKFHSSEREGLCNYALNALPSKG